MAVGKPLLANPTIKRYSLTTKAAATLGAGDLEAAVKVPPGADEFEWIAVKTLDIFNEINLLLGAISDFCTNESCPEMRAGKHYEYAWADETKYLTPTRCSAPVYTELLMKWVDSHLADKTIFPTEEGVPFPDNFIPTVKKLFRRLFRVYAHVYHSHFRQIVDSGAEAHVNNAFKHFMYFVMEFNLIEQKECTPLLELIRKLCGRLPA